MALPWISSIDGDSLHQLAGFTGFGWTASILGFLGTLVGYGNGIISRLLVGPRSLLYIAFALFLTTLGLDRLAKRLPEN